MPLWKKGGEKSRMKFFYRMTFILSLLLMSGCSLYSEKPVVQSYEVVPYTYADITGRALEGGIIDEDINTEDGLRNYSKIMSYVDHVAGKDNYFITRAYDVELANNRKDYVLKFVLKDYLDQYYKWEEYDEEPANFYDILVSSGYYLASTFEPFHMSMAWHKQLKEEFKEAYPDYHLNSFYVSLDAMHPSPESVNYNYENLSDWHLFYGKSFYKDNFYENHINVFLPEDTKEEALDALVLEMEPLLKKYCVTTVYYYILSSEKALKTVQEEERETGNYYQSGEANKLLFKYDKAYEIPLP